jgi:hypothetical protein
LVVELLGGGASTESGHNRGPSLNLRNQHCSWESLTRPLAFCSTISRDSAWLRPCIRTVRFNAPAVLTGTPVHGGTRGWAQNPSRLHAHRDPLCLTLRLITATRVLPHGYPTNSSTPDLRLFAYFPAVFQQDNRSESGTPSPPRRAEAAQGSHGGHYPRRSLRRDGTMNPYSSVSDYSSPWLPF